MNSMRSVFNTLDTVKNYFEGPRSLAHTFLVSQEYYDFLNQSSLSLYKLKIIDPYFAPFKNFKNSQSLKFLDFYRKEKPRITPSELFGSSREWETGLAQRKLSKVIEKFKAGKELFLEINLSNPKKTSSIIKKKLKKLKSNGDVLFERTIRQKFNEHLPVKTLTFLHFLMNQMVEIGSSNKPYGLEKLYCSGFLEYFFNKVHFGIFQQKISYVAILQELCLLADDLFIFEPDNYPSDLFSKMIFLATTLESYFYFDESTSKYLLSNNKTESISLLLEKEYDNFMKIIRDQFRNAIVQYLKSPEMINHDLFLEQFIIINYCFISLIDFMNLICNYFRILKNEELRVFRISYSTVFYSKPSFVFDENIALGSPESGISTVKGFFTENLTNDFRLSLRNILSLPIRYHRSEHIESAEKSESLENSEVASSIPKRQRKY